MHFSEITKLQFGRNPYIALYFKAFYKYCWLIIFEKCVVTPFFLRKNIFELEGTILKWD